MTCAAVTALAGCGPSWQYSYVKAEQIARDKDKPMLVFLRDHLSPQSGEVEAMLESGQIRPLLKPFVMVSLVDAYGPNRKYVGQCGITSAPALVIVHPDSTCHALAEVESADQIAEFINESVAPGEPMTHDTQIPRRTDFLIHAEGTYDRAADKAQRQNRKLLIIYKWWLDARSTRMLARMSQPVVANRAAPAITCILDYDYRPNRKHAAAFGVKRYPALIVVNPDGTHESLVGDKPVEEIVQFLARNIQDSTP